MLNKATIYSLTLGLAVAVIPSEVAGQISISTADVGNPGNPPDTTGSGSVTYVFSIGKYEITNSQYAAFLNAKARPSDPRLLYNPGMAGPIGGIIRSGTNGAYSYTVVPGRENNPVNYVSFWDACRFANWLHNGQADGDTETGAYTFGADDFSRNTGWRWAVTSENEWYKAAYFQPGDPGVAPDVYWVYPTSSNSLYSSQANWASGLGNTLPAGSYLANYWGTFDMCGNVDEWNESGTGYRMFRGGAWFNTHIPTKDRRPSTDAMSEVNTLGFRIVRASTPPAIIRQPSSYSVCAKTSVSLSVIADSNAVSQWRKNGVIVPNATSFTFTINPASLADAGVYDCVVSNAFGSTTSSAVTLAVTPILEIASEPTDQVATIGAPTTFVVELADTGCATTVSYQWQRRDPLVEDPNAADAWIDLRNGHEFYNVTTNALVINKPLPSIASGYRCKIGGGCGCRPLSGFIYSNTVNFSIACPADFNADGGIDFGDVEAFFERWENGC
jgi:sulfatase modifying factor 1